MVFDGSLLGIMLKEKRVSQTELCRRTGLSQSYVSELIANKKRPHSTTLGTIAEALAAKTDDFMRKEG